MRAQDNRSNNQMASTHDTLAGRAPMRVLVTGARSLPALEAARQLHRAGHEVFACDTFPRHVTERSRAVRGSFVLPSPRFEEEAFVRGLLARIDVHGIDVIVPTGEEALYLAQHRARLGCEVIVDSVEQLASLHDKWSFNQRVAACGLPAPRTWRLRTAAQLEALRRAHPRLVVKPAFTRFGLQTRVFEGHAPFTQDHDDARVARLDWGRTLLAQELIEGTELCSFSVLQQGALVAHVCYRPRYRFPLGPGYYFEPLAHPGVLAWVQRFMANTHFTGSIGFDFIETTAGALFAIECNPRMTSGILLFPDDGALGRALLGQGTAEPDLDRPAMVGLAMFASALPRLRSLADARAWWRAVRAARDALWRPHDSGPFWAQLSSFPYLVRLAGQHGLSLRQATTHQSEWNG
jgi:predicted ATP-grasp superfamily ATP-dependent carboligase